MEKKLKDIITVQDAMDNLAAIASIDLSNPPPLAIAKNIRLVTTEEDFSEDTVRWISGEGVEPVLEILDLTYTTILNYLQNLYHTNQEHIQDPVQKQGVSAMMVLVGESAQKMHDYLALRMDVRNLERIENRKSFQDLKNFYSHEFVKKFEGGIEGKNAWNEQWAQNEQVQALDLSKTGIKDFDSILQDKEYELFYIRKEDGKPYFNPSHLRNIKLTCDFDLAGNFIDEDPILKLHGIMDRDLHGTAIQIRKMAHSQIEEFLKHATHNKDNEFVKSLRMAIFSLSMAANPKLLQSITSLKTCSEYFQDFHRFLRRAYKTEQYQKLVAYPPDSTDRTSISLLNLIHIFTKALFTHLSAVRQETIGLIHRMMRLGVEMKQLENEKILKGDGIWNQFLIDDEKLRTYLSKFPNGPLFKILDLIREEQEEDRSIPFDPIGQDNLPSSLFHIQTKKKPTLVLRLPSPTKQSFIQKAEIVDEFKGFLRQYSVEKKTHLLVNLQDRTSWMQFARSKALESLEQNAEFNHQLFVLTLPKQTDFYYQIQEYAKLNRAEDFIKAFENQFVDFEQCGFHFPTLLKKSDVVNFSKEIISDIHRSFFSSKNVLTRAERENFIEIFYQVLILKCLDVLEPDSLSFTCKDAVDVGACATATFYGFIHLFNGDFSKKQEQDFMRFMLYYPALFIRERAVNSECYHRFVASLQTLSDAFTRDKEQISINMQKHFSKSLLESIRISHE